MFLDFYRLRQQPFGVTPDPAFLYRSRTHREVLASLTDGIKAGRGFLSLIAEPGMGKTTLLYQLLEGLRDTTRTAFLFQTQCNSREFFQYLLSELGVDTAGLGLVAMHNKLNEILFAEMLAGKRFVLIVDEAQNLEDSVLETIRLLSNFETPHTKLLQIVLAGQTQLAEKLAQPRLAQLQQRITVLNRLEPLSLQETAGYIEHRLQVAGHCGKALFAREALALVAERSHGIPRNINKICFHALSEACERGHETVTVEIAREAAGKSETCAATRSAPAAADSAGRAAAQVEPQLTYRPLAGLGLPAWVLWAAMLIGVLLPVGASLLRVIPWQQLRVQAEAAPSVLKPPLRREDIVGLRQALRVRESTVAGALVESSASNRGTATVTGIVTSNAENDTRVVVRLDEPVEYDSARIASPDRIYFDLHNARLSPSLEHAIRLGDGLPSSVRAAQNQKGVVRLVVGAEDAENYFAQLLSNPYRLVIDVHTRPGGRAAAEARVVVMDDVEKARNEPRVNHGGRLSLARELGLKISRIVIDPGHGGYDTGTIGRHGLLEKNLCLDVALRLGRLIEERIPDAEVIYTRKDDTYVPLEERTAIANRTDADLFISIHANSSRNQQARGVETYYLSLSGARESMELATRENALAQSSLHDLPDLLKKIARNEAIAESKHLAVDIQNALAQQLQVVSRRETNRGVKQAPFIVLTGANMASVLSEISFVSNVADESLLRDSSQRQRLAEGLYRGIAAYLDSLHSLPHNRPKLISENRKDSSFRSAIVARATAANSR
jgi:N-acetylmuramoyl-L-alanine amidase/type II secretory pathway predicted ATPase ExeA